MGVYQDNRQVRFDYEILETFEAGLELLGFEVKAIRNGRVNLAGSVALIRGGEAYLLNADIPPYQPNNTPEGYDSKRTRRLLLTREEIKYLTGKLDKSGLTLAPLKVYSKHRKIKIELGLAKRKKNTDKRATIKKHEVDREIRRVL